MSVEFEVEMSNEIRSVIKRKLQIGVDRLLLSKWSKSLGPAFNFVAAEDIIARGADYLSYQKHVEPEVVDRPMPFHPADVASDPMGHLLRRVPSYYQTHAAGLLKIEDCIVSMPLGLHLAHGYSFQEANLHKITTVMQFLGALQLRRRTGHKLSGAILLGHSYTWNYYHWMCEVAPRIALIPSDLISDIPVLIPKGMPAFVSEVLNRSLPNANVMQVEPGVYKIDCLHVPTMFSPAESVAPYAVNWLREQFRAECSTSHNADALIYVSRNDAATRRVVNEAEIIEALQPLGFQCVRLAGLTVGEQAALFSKARLVVGSHGAGHTNIAFCPPGATLIELFTPQYISACFWNMASACRMRYGYIMGSPSGVHMHVPADEVVSAVRKALAAEVVKA